MYKKITYAILIVFSILLNIPYGNTEPISATDQFFLSGQIVPPTAWKGGFIGEKVIFPAVDLLNDLISNPFGTVYIDSQWFIHGGFWVWSVGWISFNHGNSTEKVKISCPANILDKTYIDVCPVSGSVWSRNAGWISLDKNKNTATNSGVYFSPKYWNIQGFWYNKWLWWVPLITGIHLLDCEADPTLPVCEEENINVDGWVPVHFVWRVAIIGQKAGTKIFDFVNTQWDSNQKITVYNHVQHRNIIDTINKNITLLTRNLKELNGFDTFAEFIDRNMKYVYLEWKDLYFTKGTNTALNMYTHGEKITLSDSKIENIETIVVRWGDIVIDRDFNTFESIVGKKNTKHIQPKNMKALVALKDKNGNGGNIVITDDVKKIYAYTIAEGSVFSWEKTYTLDSHQINPYAKLASVTPFSIPSRQLYINWLIISKNTIGGNTNQSLDEVGKCPILVQCDMSNPPRNYDMNYFRLYNSLIQEQLAIPESRNEMKSTLKKAAVIIDYNMNILTNPPAGLENMQ